MSEKQYKKHRIQYIYKEKRYKMQEKQYKNAQNNRKLGKKRLILQSALMLLQPMSQQDILKYLLDNGHNKTTRQWVSIVLKELEEYPPPGYYLKTVEKRTGLKKLPVIYYSIIKTAKTTCSVSTKKTTKATTIQSLLDL